MSLQKTVAKMNLSYYEKSNLPKQNNMILHLLGCNGERLSFAGNSAKEEVKWKEKAHDECKVKNGWNLTCAMLTKIAQI